jgi:hypothetical protein
MLLSDQIGQEAEHIIQNLEISNAYKLMCFYAVLSFIVTKMKTCYEVILTVGAVAEGSKGHVP